MSERTAEIDDGGRGGDVIYTDAHGTLRFCWEMASFGPEVGIPTAAEWEEQTGLPLAGRLEVLQFIAERIIATRGSRRASWEVVEEPYAFLQIHL